MKKFEFEITTKFTVTEEDIDDIVCTALEGGINYWACEARVVGEYLGEWGHEQIARGGKLIIVDAEEDEEYELTKEKLLHGIKLAIEQEYYKRYSWYYEGKLDTCQIDAEVADVIIQLALFDEVVFG